MARSVSWLGEPLPDWYVDASCKDMGHDLFFAEHLEALAIRFCSSCKARQPCAAWALDNPSVVGVWGGTTTQDRRRLRRQRGRQTDEETA